MAIWIHQCNVDEILCDRLEVALDLSLLLVVYGSSIKQTVRTSIKDLRHMICVADISFHYLSV